MTPSLQQYAAAFLQAVLDNPEDDTVRLICADACEEYGDPARAELIRLQVWLAANPCPKSPRTQVDTPEGILYTYHGEAIKKWHQEHNKATGLLAQHGERWAGETLGDLLGGRTLHKWRDPRGIHYRHPYAFRRGFIEQLRLTARMWLLHGEELLSRTPLKTVRLTGYRSRLEELLGCRTLCRLQTLLLVSKRPWERDETRARDQLRRYFMPLRVEVGNY